MKRRTRTSAGSLLLAALVIGLLSGCSRVGPSSPARGGTPVAGAAGGPDQRRADAPRRPSAPDGGPGEEGEGGSPDAEDDPGDGDVVRTGVGRVGPVRPVDPGRRAGGGPDPYERVVTEDAVSSVGLLTAHRVGEDTYLEIPDSVLGREMLLIARPVESSARGGFFTGRADLVVEWSRRGERVVLRQKLHSATADSADAIWRQVSGMSNGPVIAALDVESFGPDSAAVVDVGTLFTSSNELLGSLEGIDRGRSWIESIHAFPRNVEIEAVQTGRERGAGNGGSGSRPVTARIHWSLTLLPDRPMRPRLHDRRVGFARSRVVDYSRPEHRAEERRYIHRFRLEPSDTAAFLRGERVEPVEPIVFWVDPATPDRLKPWVVKGVEAWNRAFEEAGFTDAVRARVMPTDDPGYDLHDARYSVVYWRPSEVENASASQVVDPRTGEILKGEVNMYHNVQNLVRNWYVTQVAPLDPRARSLPLPDSLMGRLVEYVVAHEVGHAIGFPHNMKASAMYPPDSLRSESFLRRMNGHVATLMDYARFNYVAQPEDSIPPDLLIPRIGPYDEFAVRWGYRPILDAENADQERAVLDDWAQAQDSLPWLRFTTTDAPNDPRALAEAVGDADAVRSSTLGLKNLERVMEMLIPVAERPGENYALLEELYGEAVDQWSRYMGHVAAVVGGAESQERYGRGLRFFPLERKAQREAVAFLRERAFETPRMLIRPQILRRIEAEGVVGRVHEAQRTVLESVLGASRLTRLVEYEALAGDDYRPYTLAELMEDVRGGVWGELDEPRVRVDVYRRNLQRSWLKVVENRLRPGQSSRSRSGTLEPTDTDVRPVLRGELGRIRQMARQAVPNAADAMTRLHLEDVVAEVDRVLEPDRD